MKKKNPSTKTIGSIVLTRQFAYPLTISVGFLESGFANYIEILM
jgi:hypothetical protein